MPDLDDRIRDLVARAVAAAPPPPAIDESTALTRTPAGDRARPGSRWVVGGLAGLSAAAALVAIVWVASDDLAEAPTTPLAPATTVAEPAETTVPVTAPDSVPPTLPDADAPPVTTLAPSAGEEPLAARAVSAGPEGVWAENVGAGGGSGRSVTSEPMAVAFRVPDDRVFMQRSSDHRDPDADTSILVAAPDGSGELVGQPMPTPELADAPLRLHDVAVVDGEVVLLIESGPGPCASPEECNGSLWALRADTGELDLILTDNMWEAGFGRIHLADTGVIVGERFSEALSMPFFAVVPSSSAVAPTLESLGLEAQYADCSTCPRSFTIDRAGTTIAWLEWETDADGVLVQAVIVTTPLDGPAERLPIVDGTVDAAAQLSAPWLELAGRRLIVNPPDGERGSPNEVDLDTGILSATRFEPGTIVTAG